MAPTTKPQPAMTTAQGVELLETLVPLLAVGRQGFANSLIASFKAKHSLTPKQREWVFKLIDVVQNPTDPVQGIDVGTLFGINQLFDKAGKKLKYPEITLALDETPITLSPAKLESANPGHIYVKTSGAYLGKVSPDGLWYPSKDLSGLNANDIAALLIKLSKEPAETAAAFGHMTGRCCFCNKLMEDPKSLSVGYGPTCSKNFGLPYGVAAMKAAQAGQTDKTLSAPEVEPSSTAEPIDAQETTAHPQMELDFPDGLSETQKLLYAHRPSRHLLRAELEAAPHAS